jgi:hypothetical protein
MIPCPHKAPKKPAQKIQIVLPALPPCMCCRYFEASISLKSFKFKTHTRSKVKHELNSYVYAKGLTNNIEQICVNLQRIINQKAANIYMLAIKQSV